MFMITTTDSPIQKALALCLRPSKITCKAIVLNHILQCRQGWRNNSHIFVNFHPLVSTCVHCSFTFTVCVCFVTIVNGLKNPTQCRLHYSNKLSPLFSASNMHHCRRLSNLLRARFGICLKFAVQSLCPWTHSEYAYCAIVYLLNALSATKVRFASFR